MARRTGVSSSTPVNLIIDGGAVYFNYGEVDERLFGATRGGNTFTVNQDFRMADADGIPGAIVGMTRITNVDPTMTVRMLEFSTENLLVAFPGAAATDWMAPPDVTATHDEIRRAQNVQATDYLKNIALVGTVQGRDVPVICMIYNGLQTGNVELGTADDDESVTELTFQGHFDVTDLDTEPWAVRYPKSA